MQQKTLLLNFIISSLSLGHVPKPFKLAVIKPLIKKPKLDPCELANYRPISNLLFMSNFLEKMCLLNCAPSCKNMISMNNFSQVLGPGITQKLHLLK